MIPTHNTVILLHVPSSLVNCSDRGGEVGSLVPVALSAKGWYGAHKNVVVLITVAIKRYTWFFTIHGWNEMTDEVAGRNSVAPKFICSQVLCLENICSFVFELIT